MSQRTTRRRFLKRSAETAALTAAIRSLGGIHSAMAEERAALNIGIIGCGTMMDHHVKRLSSFHQNVSITWLCDVDPAQIERRALHLERLKLKIPRKTSRYEDVVSDKNVDAVVIATPHHWHAPIAIQAMSEGKDCYIEKPISHVYNEGLEIIKASKKYKLVVQQGTQMRSSPVTAKAAKLLKDGIIGEIKVARAWTAENRNVVKPVADSKTPSGVAYDRWLGPAPKHTFNKHRFHKTWRMFRDYGNGEIGDDGIHDLDMACWGLGVSTVPSQITARGGRMKLHGHYSEYPDNMNVTYEYPDGRLLIYENYPFTAYGLHGFDNGNAFYGTKGYMIFSRRGAFTTFLGPKGKLGPTEGRDLRGKRGYDEHMADFLRAVRTRNLATTAPAEVAHNSCALVHFGEIAYLTSGRVNFDHKSGKFSDSDKANRLLSKTYRKPYTLPSVD